jgi:A118 family predicted phage portal protein
MSSPMGISVFANSIDKFKSIDTKYDSFNNEFEMGKKRILVDRTALKSAAQVSSDGTVTNVSYFDKNDRTYVAINGMDGQPVKEIDFSLRYEEHINSINADLNYLSAGVGLGQNYYEFNGVSTKTATEVVSENSDTYRTKNHHQIVIKDVLYDLIKSIMFLEGFDSKEIKIEFDDSIIEDENTKKEKAQIRVEKGLLSKLTYLKEYEGMTEEEAKLELQRIDEESSIQMTELPNETTEEVVEE